jgi:hypothetical protein
LKLLKGNRTRTVTGGGEFNLGVGSMVLLWVFTAAGVSSWNGSGCTLAIDVSTSSLLGRSGVAQGGSEGSLFGSL